MTFTETLNTAKDTRDPEAFIARVKASVIDEVRLLDSTAKIEDTSYFNHSAIPDLVITWPNERGERRLYLRDSYDAVLAANDAVYLDDDDPIVLSLSSSANDPQLEAAIDSQAEKAPRLLLTDASALDVIGQAGTGSSPLTELVRANFIRGAKGHIDEPRATGLVRMGEDPVLPAELPISERLRQSFFEDAAARITRTAQLIQLAIGDPGSVDPSVDGTVGGKLSLTELQTLLPWLLKQDAALANRPFWGHLGDLMSFADLESVRTEIRGLNLTPLIAANSEKWTAKRAYIGLAVPLEGDATYQARSNYWSTDGGAIGIDIGEQRLLLANNGQLIKARDNTSSASWSDVGGALDAFRLARVELHGIRRSFIINAEQSPDVRTDVQEVTQSLDDNYFVSEIAVRFPSPGEKSGTSDVQVNFDKGLVTAEKGATVKQLTSVSLKVLNYRRAVSDRDLEALLTDEADN